MRKLRMILTAAVLCIGLLAGFSVSAEESFVHDHAGLLTEIDIADLQERAEALHEEWGMNILLVTIDNAEGKSAMVYADDYYDAVYPTEDEENGGIFLIDMDNREIYLSTSGMLIRYMTDDRVDSILDAAFEEVADADYYGTFNSFLFDLEYYLEEGIDGGQYNYNPETGEYDYYEIPKSVTFFEALIAIVIALAAAGGTVGVIKAKYQLRFEDFDYDANANSEINLSVKQDRLVNSFITHRRIPKNTGSSGGSSGGGSRSTVHRSSSGRSHGGGGRSF